MNNCPVGGRSSETVSPSFSSSSSGFPVNTIPQSPSKLIYLGDEQLACWRPQFGDIVSPQRHEQQQPHTSLLLP
jgi:hypothetical protein